MERFSSRLGGVLRVVILCLSLYPKNNILSRRIEGAKMRQVCRRHWCKIFGISSIGSVGKRCLKNDELGWRPENIYECNDPSYPECCEKDREFVCCEYNVSKNLREQFQLWGTVLVFCLLLFVVYLYFTRDSVPSSTCINGTSLCACIETVGDRLLFRKRKMSSCDNKYKEDDRVSTT